MRPFFALAAMTEFQEITSFSMVSENTLTACSTDPHFPYMSIKQFATTVPLAMPSFSRLSWEQADRADVKENASAQTRDLSRRVKKDKAFPNWLAWTYPDIKVFQETTFGSGISTNTLCASLKECILT
ncbi:hypothetical protein CR513_27678, partial [Mucuna pruriens]